MTARDLPDDQLLEHARCGDTRALETLLERHQSQIYRFGLAMCRNPEDAKDVVQDTLLAMARGVRDFRGASSISTWLYTIARNFCIRKRRRRKFAPEHEQSLETDVALEAARVADAAKRPDEALASRQIDRALQQAIAALEPKYRDVLVLRDVESLTAPEAAEVLGISVQAVKSRLHRARISVRAAIAPALGIPAEPAAVAPGECPDVLAMFSRHLDGEIGADQCREMERHIAGCSRCRGTCDSLKRTLALCQRAGAPVPVPAAVQASVKVALREFLAAGR